MSDAEEARAEAERRWPEYTRDDYETERAGGFVEGAEWAASRRQPPAPSTTCEHGIDIADLCAAAEARANTIVTLDDVNRWLYAYDHGGNVRSTHAAIIAHLNGHDQ